MPRTIKTLCVITAALLLVVPARASRGQESASDPVRAFAVATRDYALMHRRLEQRVGRIEITTSIDEINRMIGQLAAAIRAERPHARQGDLFAPDIGREIKAAIETALRAHDFSAADVIAAGAIDGVDYGRIRLGVNDTFPWVLSAAMFPCVLDALPLLPPELQYRIVGRDLLLIDVHASLIVDILPAALADVTFH